MSVYFFDGSAEILEKHALAGEKRHHAGRITQRFAYPLNMPRSKQPTEAAIVSVCRSKNSWDVAAALLATADWSSDAKMIAFVPRSCLCLHPFREMSKRDACSSQPGAEHRRQNSTAKRRIPVFTSSAGALLPVGAGCCFVVSPYYGTVPVACAVPHLRYPQRTSRAP